MITVTIEIAAKRKDKMHRMILIKVAKFIDFIPFV